MHGQTGEQFPEEPLTTAAAILSLPSDEAGTRRPVVVTGVVTAAEADWRGQFFVQDETGGIFVENIGRPAPAPGDRVMVRGVSHPGAFAPIISAPQWRKLGTAPLPDPKPALIENLEAGVEDGQRVEIAGVVRTAHGEETRLVVDLAVAGYRVQVYSPLPGDLSPASLVAARVLVRGTAATHYNTALRHLTAVAVYVPRPEDFIVVQPEQADPFAQPVLPAASVAQYRRGGGLDQRVHVRGTVTWQRPGEQLFIQDASGGIRIESRQADAYRDGEIVDAVGFIDYRNRLPLLCDGVLRRSGKAPARMQAKTIPFQEIMVGKHHGELIRLRGLVVDHAIRPAEGRDGQSHGYMSTWLLQSPDATFLVEYEGAGNSPAFDLVPVGSTVEAEGVCVSTVDTTIGDSAPPVRLLSLKILLRSPSGLTVLAKPSWFTPARLRTGIGLSILGLIISGIWLRTVARKNAALKQLIRERAQAQSELQEAHDTLEQKVEERSRQLQVEMTARKTAKVQFKAVLAERTRLARDLHDTLEQMLTGIALHLDASAKLAGRDPAVSGQHLQKARNWLHQSQVDLRRSIWDLRSRELEQFDLASALRHTAEQLVSDSGAEMEFHPAGEPRSLPEVVEENILRIGQEALTNIAKHAHATKLGITLDFQPQEVVLRITDNGVGFDPAALLHPETGHYGLIGMSERAKRMNSKLIIDSQPGQGTRLTVHVPLGHAALPLVETKTPAPLT
ncbi:MAG: hypothetical protein HYV75_11420 [Opitutae bacterium]|nr:hypothetical protein [Opitutae bacterium]